jgi:hypothetical protein
MHVDKAPSCTGYDCKYLLIVPEPKTQVYCYLCLAAAAAVEERLLSLQAGAQQALMHLHLKM